MVFGGGVLHCARLRLLPGSPGTVEGTVRGRVWTMSGDGQAG